jgi:precorrin isomerase
VTIGQLSATGADPTVLRRFLALQGTWTGLVGAAAGMALGFGVSRALADQLGSEGRIAVRLVDWAIIAVTAMVVATVAAIVPTRSMASMSVLSAIGGRRPIPPVRRRQLPIGIALVAIGLFVIVVATTAAVGSSDTTAPLIAAALAGMAILAGVCFLCPLVVDLVARFGARRRGVTMLATRSLGRHRARAAALLAGIVAVGAAATAIAASVEQAVADERAFDASWVGWDDDVMMFVGYGLPDAEGAQTTVSPLEVQPDLQATVERLVGPVTWTEASPLGADADSSRPVLVADDALIAAMGAPASIVGQLSDLDVFTFVPTLQSWGGPWWEDSSGAVLTLPAPVSIGVDGLAFGYDDVFVSPAYADEQGFPRQAPILIGRAATAISTSMSDELYRQLGYDTEAAAFAEFGPPPAGLGIRTDISDGGNAHLGWIRLGAIGGTLLLMALIVTLGMALWAAEGRDERDTLVAIGASPSALARIAGTKAWLLAFVGAALAVPLGFGTVRLAVGAADQQTTFPWVFAISAIVGLPLVIGVGAWAASAIGQRVHRVTASSSRAD